MEDIPAGVQNNIKIIDDTMLYEGGMEECFFATCEYVDLSVTAIRHGNSGSGVGHIGSLWYYCAFFCSIATVLAT